MDDTIRLPRHGREPIYFTFAGLPADAAPEAQIGSGAWHPLEKDGADWVLLVRGPDFVGTAEGVLVAAESSIRFRVIDDTAEFIRPTVPGIIELV